MTTNEAAERPDSRRIQMAEVNEAAMRLRRSLKFGPDDPWPDLDAALAAERRATVRKVLERLEEQASLRARVKLYARIRKVILEVAE